MASKSKQDYIKQILSYALADLNKLVIQSGLMDKTSNMIGQAPPDKVMQNYFHLDFLL